MARFVEVAVGAALIAGSIALFLFTPVLGAAVAEYLILAGVGMLIGGTGSLLTHNGPLTGTSTASRNPIAPRSPIYGRAKVGGTVIDIIEFGDSNKYLDFVIAVAPHRCKSVDALLFDGIVVPIDSNGCSYSRPDVTVFPSEIKRVNGLVTVTCSIATLGINTGDTVVVDHVPGDLTLNGTVVVTVIDSTHFTYVSGGNNADVINAGHVTTHFMNWKAKVYMEVLLGDHTETFRGMRIGTPYDGDPGNVVTNPSNTWTSDKKCLGCTVVMLRLHYNDEVWANGIPQISFYVSGKDDIYDPRLGDYGDANTTGYTENATLCIADFLAHPTWGFKALYGTKIPITPLVSAANICDEQVLKDDGTYEPRYTCNGTFPLTMRRGEILQNLLTSCGGRLTYTGGQYKIWPAAWQGIAGKLGTTSDALFDPMAMAAGPFRWKPCPSSRELYNGVKGTYISPENNWQPSDIPPYAQDALHRYTDGQAQYNHDLNLEADGGIRRWKEIQLPFTISCPMAQRLEKIELLRSRMLGTGTFAFNLAGYQLTTLDVVQFTLPFLNWVNKELEITAHRLTLNRQDQNGVDVTLIGTEIDVQETDPEIYDWSPDEELSPQGYQQAPLPSTYFPKPPTNVQVHSDASTVTQGADGMLVTWDAPTDAYVLNGGHLELRYQVQGDDLWTGLPSVDPSVTQVLINGLVDGTSYMVEIRSVNAAGVPSVWVVVGPTKAVGVNAPLPWQPGFEVPVDNANISQDYNFGLKLTYDGPDANQNYTADLNVLGFPPNNNTGDALPPDLSTAVVTVQSTGGSLVSGNYIISLAVNSHAHFPSKRTKSIAFTVPGGVTNGMATLSGIVYPSDVGNVLAYIGDDPTDDGSLTQYPAQIFAGSTPSSINFTSMPSRTLAPTDTNFYKYHVQALDVFRGGVWAMSVLAVNGANITFSGPNFNANQFAGYPVELIGQGDTSVKMSIWRDRIVSNGAADITVSQDASDYVHPGDTILCRFKISSFTSNSFTDNNIDNSLVPGGYTPGNGSGEFVVVLDHEKIQQIKTVAYYADNKTVNVSGDFDPPLNEFSQVLILYPTVVYDYESDPVDSRAYSPFGGGGTSFYLPVAVTIPAKNYAGQLLFIRGYTESKDGVIPDTRTPVRMIYISGKPGGGGTASDGYFNPALNSDRIFPIELSNGLNQRIVLSADTATGSPLKTDATVGIPTLNGNPLPLGTTFTLYVDQDATGLWDPLNFVVNDSIASPPITGAFASDVPLQGIDGTPNTRTVYIFTQHESAIGLDSFRTGAALS